MLLCQGDKLYTGIAKDVEARFKAHVSGKGAAYTRINKPVRMLAQERHSSRSAALKAEYALKQVKSEDKWLWVTAHAKKN